MLILNGLSHDLPDLLWLDSLRSSEVKRVANGAGCGAEGDGERDGPMACEETADGLAEAEVHGGAGWG